jgi:phenylalanyl-tRNA synthetase alpha subunit
MPGGTTGEQPHAAYSPGGTIKVKTGEPVTHSTLFHEITHAGQDLRGKLKPKSELTPEEFSDIEKTATARGKAGRLASEPYTLEAAHKYTAENEPEPVSETDQDIEQIAEWHELDEAEKYQLREMFYSGAVIEQPEPKRTLDDDLKQLAEEQDLSPSEIAAIKQQYEKALTNGIA